MSHLLVADSLYYRACFALVQTIEPSHVFVVQLETVDVRITNNPSRCVTLWKRNVALL